MRTSPKTTNPDIALDARARLKQWLESGEAKLFPLSLPQRELWEASPVPVADTANHICCLIQVRGLLTERDIRFVTPDRLRVRDRMTPRTSLGWLFTAHARKHAGDFEHARIGLYPGTIDRLW